MSKLDTCDWIICAVACGACAILNVIFFCVVYDTCEFIRRLTKGVHHE